MSYLTRREIFDKVRDHLLTQNEQATNEEGECRYRGDRGTKCAVGCLITDEAYNSNFEGATVGLLGGDPRLDTPRGNLMRSALLASGIDVTNVETLLLLESLQQIHDSTEPCTWFAHLDQLEADQFDEGAPCLPL
jgi:hypothetical protein